MIKVDYILKRIMNHPNWNKVLQLTNSDINDTSINIPDEETRAFEIAILLNQHIFSYGMNGIVFNIDNYIVKIPLHRDGIQSNKNEIFLWSNISKEYKHYLAPIIAGNENILIFEKVSEISCEEFDYREEEIMFILCLLDKEGFSSEDSEDERFEQWGKNNQHLVLLDYGDFEKVKQKLLSF